MTAAARRELREELVARIPAGYSPWVHLAVPTLLGLVAIAGSLALLREIDAWQLALVPVFLVAGNAIEWHAHRGLLHRHVRLAGRLHRAHAQHHRVFASEDMALRDRRELRLILLPWEAYQLILAVALPITVALAAAGQHNVAALWIASAVAYVLAYEWMHLAYHLPLGKATRWVPLLAALRHHHAMHHAPQLQRFNLNVTVPLWDLVHGTLWQPASGAAERHASR